MRLSLLCVLAVLAGCSKKETDSAESEVLCPGDSIYVEVCVECGDAGGCEEMDYACRSICDAQEDCPDGTMCISSDDGNYCDSPCD